MNKGGYKSIIYITTIMFSIIILSLMYTNVSKGYSIQGSIYISSEGVPKIVLNGTVEGTLEKIPLPADPLPASVALYIDGELIAPIVVNRSVVITSNPGSRFSISYIPSTNVESGIISFIYQSDYDTEIYIDRNIVLLSLPANILDSKYEDNTLVIKFNGKYNIRYTVKEGAVTPPPPETDRFYTDILPVLVVIAGGGALAAFFVVRMRSRRSKAEEYVVEELIDETDKLIMDRLKEHGGELYQSEIMRILGIPKTTLWRHLRRLEVLGFITIKKEYKKNRVILKRHYSE